MNEDNNLTLLRRREMANERRRRWLARQSQESLDAIRVASATANQIRRASETLTETQTRRNSDAATHRERRAAETLELTQARRNADAVAHRDRRLRNLLEHQTCINVGATAGIINQSNSIDAVEVERHYCGPMNSICQFCNSKNFAAERPSDGKFTTCCRKGKVKLEKPTDVEGNVLSYPDFLRDLMTNPADVNYKNFRENIRSYNSAVSFASMGAKLVNFNGGGPYVFKVHGQIFHQTSHTLPMNNQSPQYAQLYVIDSTQATDIRVRHPANQQCNVHILNQIDRFFRQHNRLSDTYRMLRDVETRAMAEANQAGHNLPVVNMVFRRDRRSDLRRYNEPNANEIAMVFVNSNGEPPFERDIRVYPVNPQNPQQPFININILSPNLDPMSYPILFPYGEAGWQPNWHCQNYNGARENHSRVNVTMLQYKVALTAIRDEFNPIISAGKLSQQWIVDSYLQVESNNLNFIRNHQQHLRSELYQGLADHIENGTGRGQVGIPVILPSSFEGSPRNMRERCADAMSIFAKHGAPDLFITFTANPKWPEIVENLKFGENSTDRPDLMARVFKLKLKSLMEDLTIHCVLGKATAFVYTIEFQKRGLPHAHILIVLRTEDKFSNIERIDQVVCAEIPADNTSRLYDIVTKCMMHGPCGINKPGAPCMENGQCKKMFPKQFQLETKQNTNGYALYRRRPNVTANVRGTIMDNRFVVPYNPYLLLKYNAHINVEVCTSLRAVKYIYKYIYKGFDCINMVITTNEDQHNEITNYIDARYISAPEAMWRLLESKMHDRSHAVIRLPVHLPNQQRIIFQAGHEERALEAARLGQTKLESWFQLNQRDPDARTLLYTNIPYSYVYIRGNWQKRQRRENKIVARMYVVSLKDEERFYLRMLLLHVPGATSFEFLRTVDNVVYNTFKQAAFNRHLLDSDEEWDRCLYEAATYQMPTQLRQTFAYILCFCNLTEALLLWNKYSRDMSLDYLRDNTEETALNQALHDINATLQQHGLSCASFGLPVPTGRIIDVQLYNQVDERNEAERRIATFNAEQLAAFTKIVSAMDNPNGNKYFYLDGPGGSGKTYLYSTILSYIRGKGDIALPFATTGIAATLLKGGRTVHSGFKLPVPLLETSVSSMRTTSPEAENLRQARLIIIDEITMLPKDGLRCIDLLLREIMNSNVPFGGKIMIIGGDFRQTLPVVAKGTRIEIIETCIKSSPLWHKFSHIALITNMRSIGQDQYSNWLLKIGSGNLPEKYGLPANSIEIPQQMIEEHNLIEAIYSDQLSNMENDDLSKRIILAPTIKKTLEMNQEIIAKLQGDAHIYYSSDSIVSEDPNDALNYPSEFLHEQTPSGMPPHILSLKTGVIVMLLRNLNPKQGLCNGTRLAVTGLHENFISAEIISGCNRGNVVFLPRVDLSPSDVNLPFILKRRQFPIIPAYAMTINKSQGQTFEHVGIFLDEPVFSHGQLYVALSRSRNSNQVKVYMRKSAIQGELIKNHYFTQNIVYREVFMN